jgi:predicted small lipoprotein YifL
MTRCRIVSIVAGATLAALLAGCGLVRPLDPLATVTLYGR